MWSNHTDVAWLWTDAEGQQGGVLMFSLMLVCKSSTTNSRWAGDFGRHCAHGLSVLSYDARSPFANINLNPSMDKKSRTQ